MKQIQINGKTLLIKDYYCQRLPNKEYITKTRDTLWLYVNVTNECPAHCPFCVSGSSGITTGNTADPRLFEATLQSIAPFVGGISFTGGEPMLYPELLDELISIADRYVSDEIGFDMVTNGLNMNCLPELPGIRRLSTIHISRHSQDDQTNRHLMCWKEAPSLQDISDLLGRLPDPDAVVFNCVTQKSGVESIDDMSRYLDTAIKLKVRNTSFITMFPASAYCREQYIPPAALLWSEMHAEEWNSKHKERFLIWNQQRDHDFCSCITGSYENLSGRTRFYIRRPGNTPWPKFCRQLVFTADNHLKDGFGVNSKILK